MFKSWGFGGDGSPSGMTLGAEGMPPGWDMNTPTYGASTIGEWAKKHAAATGIADWRTLLPPGWDPATKIGQGPRAGQAAVDAYLAAHPGTTPKQAAAAVHAGQDTANTDINSEMQRIISSVSAPSSQKKSVKTRMRVRSSSSNRRARRERAAALARAYNKEAKRTGKPTKPISAFY
jgi:hypothetical protein